MKRFVPFAALLLGTTASAQTQGTLGFYRSPAIHGETIVFAAEGDLWTVPIAGGLARRLTSHAAEESSPAISPDGNTLAFTARYEGPAALYTMPITGGAPVRRTYDGDNANATTWTPDGRLVYTTVNYTGIPKPSMVQLDLRNGTRNLVPLAGASEGKYDAITFCDGEPTPWYCTGTGERVDFCADPANRLAPVPPEQEASLAAAYCAAALALPVSLLSDEVGAAGIPVALAAVLGAAGALLTLLTLLRPEGRAWSVSPRSAGLLAILAAYVIALQSLIEQSAPAVVLMPHTYQTRDFAPMLATRMRRPLVTDVTAINGTGQGATFSRPMFQGKLVAEVRPAGDAPALVTIQIGAFRADAARRGGGAPVTAFAVTVDAAAIRQKPEAPFQEARQAVDLSQAERIVSVGRGIKSKENLPVAERLAAALKAELAASRPICDNGWLPMERQIGSSGQTVAPKLYVALGISGAIQHLVGMKGSRTIVAINKDADAPIFGVADVGVVGDLFEIVPALTKAVKEAKP